jgi:hypothetical protein
LYLDTVFDSHIQISFPEVMMERGEIQQRCVRAFRRNIFGVQPLTIGYSMPVDLRAHNSDEPINVRPGTNEADILKLLYTAPHLGFTPAEIENQTGMAAGSVTTTLTRLLNKGYIGKTSDGLYHALADSPHIARFAKSLVKLDHIATKYPNAGFDDELVEDVDEDDTGRQSIPESRRDELTAEQETTEIPVGDDLVIDEEPDSDPS